MIPPPKLYTINKIEAAGCQLDTAIKLVLDNTDEVSACVLSYTAWNVTKDLLKHQGKSSSTSWMLEFDENANETSVWNRLKDIWNFCKHADRDPERSYQFPEAYVEVILLFAIHDFSQISVQSEYMDLYQLWFVAKHKDLYELQEPYEIAAKLFPDLHTMSLVDQRRLGAIELAKIFTP